MIGFIISVIFAAAISSGINANVAQSNVQVKNPTQSTSAQNTPSAAINLPDQSQANSAEPVAPKAEVKPAPTPQPTPSQPATPTTPQSKVPEVSAEFKSALYQAGTYANSMHMSKQGIYDQLVSEYGGKFNADAATYAINNVKADWNANALASAKVYQNTMHLSVADIHDQLTSEYGEKFTNSEADYAIAHL